MRRKQTLTPPTPEMVALLKQCGDSDWQKAMAAQYEVAQALSVPLRKGIMDGDNLNGIYEIRPFEAGVPIEFPKDFLTPGTEGDYFAYVAPNTGKIPHRMVAGDYVAVPTFTIVNSIDTSLKYLQQGRWDIQSRMLRVLNSGFTLKVNNDSWHTTLTAAEGRNQVITDSAAPAGLFTKRLVAVLETQMNRLGGGNVTSEGQRRLTDMFGSLEMVEDMRSWDLTQVDDVTRREIYVGAGEAGTVSRVFGKYIHPMTEFGVGQRYQNYWDNTLAGSMGASDVEMGVGIDMSADDSFLLPIIDNVAVFPDPTEHRAMKASWYAWMSYGVVALESRAVLAFSF